MKRAKVTGRLGRFAHREGGFASAMALVAIAVTVSATVFGLTFLLQGAATDAPGASGVEARHRVSDVVLAEPASYDIQAQEGAAAESASQSGLSGDTGEAEDPDVGASDDASSDGSPNAGEGNGVAGSGADDSNAAAPSRDDEGASGESADTPGGDSGQSDGSLSSSSSSSGDEGNSSTSSGASFGASSSSASSAASSGASSGSLSSGKSSSSGSSASSKGREDGVLETSITTADGRHYTVRITYSDKAEVPDGAELSVVQVLQTPDGYDPAKPEFKGRPSKTERFASADELSARKSALAKSVDAREGDYTFYEEFLDISITAEVKGKEKVVQPAAPVEVTVETDAVEASASDSLRASFFTQVPEGADHADMVSLDNRSGDAASDKKYDKGTKLVFKTDKLSELGLAGVGSPLDTWEAGGYELTVYGPEHADAWRGPASAEALPEGTQLVDAFSLHSAPERPFGTQLWLAAREADGSTAAREADGDAGGSSESALACYALEGGEAQGLLFEGATEAPVAVKAGSAAVLVTEAAPVEGAFDEGRAAEEAAGIPALAALLVAGDSASSATSSPVLAVNMMKAASVMTAADLEPAPTYTATWVDEDGTTVLDSQVYTTAPFTPQYTKEAPSKAATAQYTYTFKGWTSSLDTAVPKTIISASATAFPQVSEDVVYTAVYEETVNTYTVTWKDDDGTELRADTVAYGEMPNYGNPPTKQSTATTTYAFAGWTPDPVAVTQNATYTATYASAAVELCIQDYQTKQPVAGAQFTLTNDSTGAVWTSEATTTSGILWIPPAAIELTPGTTYTLRQTASSSAYFCPQGTWTLTVGSDGKFSSTTVTPSSASDLTTRAASGPYGIRFYLFNIAAANITYNYNYPPDKSGQPADETYALPDLGYSVQYTVPVDDPSIDGYEFVGWVVDSTTRTAKKGGTVSLDTVNVKEHTMTARWRSPLNVVAKTYENGDISHATTVDGSAGAFAISEEKSLTFGSLQAVCEAYGAQNEAVQNLNTGSNFEFAFAQIVNGSSTTRISALQYDAGTHAWQYKASGGSTWTDVGQGDQLQLYYTSQLFSVQWVMQADDGSFTALDSARFPDTTVAVSSEWVGSDELVAAADRPVVYGLGYFRSFGIGTSGVSQASDLEKAGLSSFSLRNSENGFLFREGSSGEGELLSGNTIYLVYSETPPDNSTYLDISNYTGWPYKVDSLFVGGTSGADDLLAQGKVVLLGESTLQVMNPADTVAPSGTAQLVLLGTGATSFVLDGGLVEEAEAGTVVSAAVAGSVSVVRTALVKEAGSDPLANTADVTRGMLEAAPGKVVVSFDSNLRDLTVKKTWSDDSYPEHYQVDFALFEDGVRCTTDTAASTGYYVVAPDDWSVVIPHLPVRCSYNVVEQAVRRVNGSGSTTADETDKFVAAYDSTSQENVITVSNTRSSAVCQVGSEKFTTIKAAVDYIVGQHLTTATIEMLSDYIMAESGSVTIPAGYDIALTTVSGEDAKTVTRGFSGVADMFRVEGSLAITDVTLTGKLDNALLAKDGNGGLVVVGAGATLIAGPGSTFTNGKAENGSAIYALSGATVKLAGARITANRATGGGAVGVADATCRIILSGDSYVYGNRNGDNYGNYNIYLDQDSNEVIQVVDGGLGSSAQVGVYVPNGESSALYNAHGAPAKPFAVYDEATKADLVNANLNKLVNDRISSAKSNYGSASTILDDTIVWGETFSFTAKKQWLDDRFNVISAPAGATSTLRLSGGSTTPADSAKTTVTLDGTEAESWTYRFTGLAKYDGSGNPYEYKLVESNIPADFKQVIFTGDKAIADNPIMYSVSTGDDQVAIVSNYYRYTTLTVNKTVSPADQGLKSTFAVYGVPKTGADLSSSIRYGGVGSVSDLPLDLRGSVAASQEAIAEDALFHTVDGGNHWYVKAGGSVFEFHRFYDEAFDEFSNDGSGVNLRNGEAWQAGDVVRFESGACSVFGADSSWHALSSASVSYISFNRQDGNGGVEGVGGVSMGKSCTIDCSASSTGTYTFTTDEHLSSDYYYYVVETSVQETDNQGRTISGSHKIVATYDPAYAYDQLTQTVDVVNTRQDYLSVDKIWPEDATSYGECVFDVYKVNTGTGLGTVAYLSDPASFKQIAKANYETWVADGTATLVGTASLPEADTGSWVHAFKDISQDDLASNVYFVRERSAGGIAILNPDVSDSSTSVDAVYGYDAKVNQITVHNMSDILCKVVDSDGTEHPFRTLNDALTYGRTRPAEAGSNTEFVIEMLRDYSIPASDVMALTPGENITLTTASTTTGTYKYKNGDESVTRATITRKAGNTWSFVRVNGDASDVGATSFTLVNLALDGSDIQVSYKVGNANYYNGSFVYATNATVVLKKGGEPAAGVEMRNAKASNGGAVYAITSNVDVSDAVFENCQSTDTNSNWDRGGGAIWTSGVATKVVDSQFTSCTTKRRGGAIASMSQSDTGSGDEATMLTNCTFTICTAGIDGGAVYSRNSTFDMDDCSFAGCTAVYRGGGVFHDNMKTGSTTNIDGCTFSECKTTGGDDTQNSRHGGGGLNANTDHFNIASCSFDSCRTYIRGGGLVHLNLVASESNVTNCTFTNCETDRSGGGGMGLTGVVEHVKGCTFTDCKALVSAGGGLDVVCFDVDKTAFVEDCQFVRCVAGNANGGGICFGGMSLTVTGSTFDACEATTQHGGGIAVSAGGTMQELDVYGCTFESCAARGNSGGAVYSQALVTNVGDDPRDSSKHTTFANCWSKSNGGAIWQDRNAEGTSVTAENCSFDTCYSTNSQGGALRVNGTTLGLKNCDFQTCSALGHGGSVYQGIYGTYVEASSATVTGCTFRDSTAGSSSSGAYGGALYTEAKALAITGSASETTFENCTARSNGGAVIHNRSNLEGATTTVDTCSFKNCTSETGSGAGLFTYAPAVELTNATFDDCAARGSGGAVYHNHWTYVSATSMKVTGCSFETAKSEAGYAGALYTSAQDFDCADTTFHNITSYNPAGAVMQDRNTEASTATLANVSFDTCESTNGHGGTFITYATKLAMTDSSFIHSTARNGSGAVYHSVNGNYVASSEATVTRCTFEDCESRSDNAGTLYSNALTLTVTGEAGVTTFKDSKAYKNAGAIQHDRNWEASKTVLSRVSFDTCAATTQSGGAVLSYATKLEAQECSFKDCTSKSTAGALYQSVNNNYVASSDAKVYHCTFDNCESTNASSGAIFSNALTLAITGQAGTTTFKDCTASGNGGAVNHDRNWEAARITVAQCSFDTCEASNGRGGALYSGATKASITDSSYVDCTAKWTGGAVYHAVNNNYVSSSETLVSHGVFENCKSTTGNAGALYSEARSITVNGGSGRTVFTNCSSAYDGGAFYQNRNGEGSNVTLSNCDFNICTTTYTSGNNRGGGAYVRARELTVDGSTFNTCIAKGNGGCLAIVPEASGVNTATITNSAFTGGVSQTGNGGAIYDVRVGIALVNTSLADSTAAGSGGGLYFDDWEQRSVTLDGCTVSGNKAASYGGGVYFYSDGNLTLRNGTSVTGNALGSTTVDSAAGIYLNRGRSKGTLVLGSEGVENDTITVFDNTTSAGAQSNVRLVHIWTKDPKTGRYYDREDSVSLLSNLVKPGVGATGTVGVCNPGPENTRFGLGNVGNHTGTEYIMSDIDTLIGKIDPSDLEGKRIIWYAPPVCKITDQYGRILTYDVDKTAAFSTLAAAYEVANVLTPGYIVDDKGVTPSQIQIQMLVADYPLEASMPALKRDITLTTADAGPGEYDYPQHATAPWCTIKRSANVSGSMFTAASGKTMTVTKLTLDGGNNEASPLVASANGGIIYGQVNSAIVLSENAVLQNSAVSDSNSGGAVFVTGGSDDSVPALVMERNAKIRNCSAGDGGGVYLTGGVLFRMNDAPHIEACSASGAGGAVYVSPYATMHFYDNPNGVIRDNYVTSVDGEGAGIYLPNNNSKLYLQLGASADISGNYVAGSDDSERVNGGEAYPILYQDIYLGETDDPVTSIELVGNLSLDEGSIWVWARAAEHYKTEMQFAVVVANAEGNPAFTPLDSTLAVFRNARDDVATENDTDEYLYGIRGDGVNVIWSYTAGSAKVILRKVADTGASYTSLSGAVFTVYKGRSTSAYVVRHDDGTRETLSGLTSGENGVFWIGTLPYGTYYLEETAAPSGYASGRWFKLTIDENGVVMSQSAASRSDL